MRIGIMLRSIGDKGGIGVYTRYLTEELLRIDHKNQYTLFYSKSSHLDHFAAYKNATASLVQVPNKAIWDQVVMPIECYRHNLDVLLHPKFTVPLLAPCKTVMVLHGADWFIPDQAKFYKQWDVRYIKAFMPTYCRKASSIISVSQLTTDNFIHALGLPSDKIRTVYFGPAKHFRRIDDLLILREVRERYQLPDKFILTLSKYDGGERKNIRGILDSFRIHHGKTSHKLVVAGNGCSQFRSLYHVDEMDCAEDILFYDWVEQEDLPAFYSLADLYLYPSYVEAFPIPLTEAMACGTPIITSDVNGLKEIAGEAAVLVDPSKPEKIAEAMTWVLSNAELRRTLGAKGLARAKQFSWEKCARQTLEILEGLGSKSSTGRR